MKTKGNWVIKYESGVYFCGNSYFDKQLRKAKVYHWKEAAEEQAEHMRTKRYSPVVDETYEIVEISEPKELKDTEARWMVAGIFDDFLKCSNCEESWPWQTAIEFNFCPKCGKLMLNHEQPEDDE